MRLAICTVLLAGGLHLTGSAFAQTLQEDLDDLDVADRWTYDDWESARAAAIESKKPIMALFR